MRKTTMFILTFIFCISLSTTGYSTLRARWPLDADEYSSGQHEDLVNGYDATANGSPVFVYGVSGIEETAVEIDPSNGWATSSEFDLTSSNAFTISIWSKWEGSQTQDTNDLSVISAMGGTSNLGDATGSIGQWRHLCITYDETDSGDGEGVIYLNGQEVYREYWPEVDLGDLVTQIGHNDGSGFFNGSIDEIRLYNSDLSSSQVSNLYSRSTDCTLSGFDDTADVSGPYGVPDCRITLYDYPAVTDLDELAELAEDWLSCGLYPDCD